MLVLYQSVQTGLTRDAENDTDPPFCKHVAGVLDLGGERKSACVLVSFTTSHY